MSLVFLLLDPQTSFVKVIDKISSGAATIFVNEQGKRTGSSLV